MTHKCTGKNCVECKKEGCAIKMPVKELVKEHKELTKTLKEGKKSKIKAEYKKQSKELKSYKSKL